MTIAPNFPDKNFSDEVTVTLCLIEMDVPETHNLREKKT
jgi:hypothetical protein